MLITMQQMRDRFDINPQGVMHLGAHLGEEAPAYAAAGVSKVVWVEANSDLMPGLQDAVYPYRPEQIAIQACVSDEDGKEVIFRRASFSMSSSILPMTGHLTYYPTIVEIGAEPIASITTDTLMKQHKLSPKRFDMVNIDLEGAELIALRGMPKLIKHLNWVYTEVYFEELYAGCAILNELDDFLSENGFDRTATEDTHMGWGDALYTRRSGSR